jgi:hypothetical protein
MIELVIAGIASLLLGGRKRQSLPPKPFQQFEVSCAEYLQKQGFEAKVTPPRGDGNVDIFVRKDGQPYGIAECKSWGRPVGAAVLKILHATMLQRGYVRGWVFSRAGFSDGAYDYVRAIREEIILVPGVGM